MLSDAGLVRRLIKQQGKRFLLRVLPGSTIRSLRWELHMTRVRMGSGAARRRFRGARGLLVNIGAGAAGRQDWVNMDVFSFPNVDCVYDCRRSLPFDNGSVQAIFCEHVLEHFDYSEEAPRFLRECRRVLVDGGVIRVVVPDAEQYLRGYCVDGWELVSALR